MHPLFINPKTDELYRFEHGYYGHHTITMMQTSGKCIKLVDTDISDIVVYNPEIHG